MLQPAIIYKSSNTSILIGGSFKLTTEDLQRWVKTRWYLPYYAVTLYLLLSFGMQSYMASRKPMKLRRILIAWNAFLSIYSILTAYMVFFELVSTLRRHELRRVVCDNHYAKFDITLLLAGFLFMLSKFFELGDTLFIVLRKKKLIFLHWYHHVTVLLLCWYAFEEIASVSQWFGPVNAFVHSIMYTYFTFRSMRVKIPRWISMCITIVQILQMITGSYVTWIAYTIKLSGSPCHTSYKMLNISVVIYLSYLFLFLKFFYNAYISPTLMPPKKTVEKTK